MLSARSQLPGLKGFAYYDAIGPWGGADKGLDVQLNFNYYFFLKKKNKTKQNTDKKIKER